MHKQALWHINPNHTTLYAGRIARRNLANRRHNRRLDGIIADIAQPCLSNLKFVFGDPFNLTSLVVDPKEENCTRRIGRRRDLVSDILHLRLRHSLSRYANGLKFTDRILSKPNHILNIGIHTTVLSH